MNFTNNKIAKFLDLFQYLPHEIQNIVAEYGGYRLIKELYKEGLFVNKFDHILNNYYSTYDKGLFQYSERKDPLLEEILEANNFDKVINEVNKEEIKLRWNNEIFNVKYIKVYFFVSDYDTPTRLHNHNKVCFIRVSENVQISIMGNGRDIRKNTWLYVGAIGGNNSDIYFKLRNDKKILMKYEVLSFLPDDMNNLNITKLTALYGNNNLDCFVNTPIEYNNNIDFIYFNSGIGFHMRNENKESMEELKMLLQLNSHVVSCLDKFDLDYIFEKSFGRKRKSNEFTPFFGKRVIITCNEYFGVKILSEYKLNNVIVRHMLPQTI